MVEYILNILGNITISKKMQFLKDINALRNMLYAKFGEDVSLIYNRKDKCYELLIIAGKAVVVDLPYSI